MTALAKFGIELRKVGSAKTLYREVDRVLSNNGLTNGGVTVDVQIQAIGHSLQKMLEQDKFFSVCTIDACLKIAKIRISSERAEIYSASHCMHWSTMTPEYRSNLVAMILDDFRPVLNPEETIIINKNS